MKKKKIAVIMAVCMLSCTPLKCVGHINAEASEPETIRTSEHSYKAVVIDATFQKGGSITYVCEWCGKIGSKRIIAKPAQVELSTSRLVYNGANQYPSVVVRDSAGIILSEQTDYVVKVPEKCKDVGVYTLRIEFRGKYEGSIEKTYEIIPVRIKFKKVSAGSRRLNIKWKRQKKQLNGYEIEYSTNSHFPGKTTNSIWLHRSKNKREISGLKAKRRYYVRIRAYKIVKVNGKEYKINGDWSATKTRITRK